MAEVDIDVHGLRELRDAMKQLPKELIGKRGGPLKTALMGATLPILKSVKSNIISNPTIDTGSLLKAIKRRRERNPEREKLAEIIRVGVFGPRGRTGSKREDRTSSNVWYAHFTEFGVPSRNIAPEPYLRPALAENAEKSVRIFRRKAAMLTEKIATKIGHENARRVAARVKTL